MSTVTSEIPSWLIAERGRRRKISTSQLYVICSTCSSHLLELRHYWFLEAYRRYVNKHYNRQYKQFEQEREEKEYDEVTVGICLLSYDQKILNVALHYRHGEVLLERH